MSSNRAKRRGQRRAEPEDLREFARSIERAMLSDQHRLRSRLRSMRSRADSGKPYDQALADCVEKLEQSSREREARVASIPSPSFPDDLPIAQKREQIAAAIRDHQVVVVCGETGSGKTTQLPKICLDLGRGAGGMIGHTQPRRIAARTVAKRVSQELGSAIGSTVGFKVRFGDRTSKRSLVKLMTDGILLAETQRDRSLFQYDTLIIDEAHERSLNIDFLLGYLRQLLPRRPDLRLIITSATIDPQRFSNHFAGADGTPAPVIEVSGRTYPVEVRYRPIESEDDPDEDSPEMQRAIRDAVDEVVKARPGGGDILIFHSGEREIRATAKTLRKHGPRGAEILPLYSRLSVEEQDKVFAAHKGRRIVLATNVAETSLTVPGIHGVIDPGFARISRYSARRKVQGLPIEPVSRASADQRKGRCGRVAPGVCVRLYSKESYDERSEFTDPEILRTNLASVILQMTSLRLGRIEDFPFIEKPDPRMIRDAYETLHEIGALESADENAGLTEIGRRLARLPVDPRVGRMILAAEDQGVVREMLTIAAALSVQDPRDRPMEVRAEADAAHERFVKPGCEESDFMTFLAIWDEYHEQAAKLTHGKLRQWCKANFLSAIRMREWVETRRQLLELCREIGLSIAPEHQSLSRDDSADGDEGANPRHPLYAPIHRALLTGLLSNIGVLSERHEYAGPRSGRFSLFPGSIVFGETPKWVVCAELVRTTKLYGRTVARVQPRWIEQAADHLVKRTWSEPHWNERTAQVWGYERVTLFGLELVPRRHRHFGPHNPEAARQIFIQKALVDGEFESSARFFRHNLDLLDEVRELQARERRHDLLASLESRFDFYESRLPKWIYTGKQFDEWIRHEQRSDPDVLCMSIEDLLPEGTPDVDAEAFPEEIEIAGATLPLSYEFEPGSSSDGVTANVPVAVLGSLAPERVEWLVPGLLHEKIVAMIRTLPKDQRRHISPASEFARKCEQQIEYGKGSLFEQVSRALSAMTGLPIRPDAWDGAGLPDHLRLNLNVVEPESGQALASGRDVAALRKDLHEEIESARLSAPENEWVRDGLTDFEIDELPDQIELELPGGTVVGHPAIVPDPREWTGVSLRLMPDRVRAADASRAGLRRLLLRRSEGEIRFFVRNHPSVERLALAFAPIGAGEELERGLMTLITEFAFSPDPAVLRTKQRFERRLDEGWHRLGSAGERAIELVDTILRERTSLETELDREAGTFRDFARGCVQHQLSQLVYPAFLRTVPPERLEHLPRYLAGARVRMERLSPQSVQRDAELQGVAGRFWNEYVREHSARSADPWPDPGLEALRWRIEELRVSFFAQELGVPEPVSEKRLDREWERWRRSGLAEST